MKDPLTVFYDFPKNLTLFETRSIVAAHNAEVGFMAFQELVKDGYVVFNILISNEDTFDTSEPPTSRKEQVLRECRGIMFSPMTDDVLRIGFQKFFNVNQTAESRSENIDWTFPHRVLEKLDGSMLIPFLPEGGTEFRWGTKRGVTEVAGPVEEYVKANPKYDAIARDMHAKGKSPIFEWCSRKQRIILDYPKDRLVMTAVRDMGDGSYMPYPEMVEYCVAHDVEVVRCMGETVGEISAFLKHTADLKDAEGYVIRFDNGHMVKTKSIDYCLKHSTMDGLRNEKDVWRMILEERLDDVLPLLPPMEKERVERFEKDFTIAIQRVADRIQATVDTFVAERGRDKKTFAVELATKANGFDKGLLFAAHDGKNMVDTVRKTLLSNARSGPSIEAVRHHVGRIDWATYGVTTEDAA